MRRKKKIVLVCAALILGSVCACAAIKQEYNDIAGNSATIPEGSNVTFNNRHAPPLNNTIPTEDSDDERDIYSPSKVAAEDKNAK